MRVLSPAVSALALVSGMALTMPAVAQDLALEEIVVTARKISERLQDVPVAVTVFTDQQIQEAGITRPADFIALTPNVSITQSQDVGTTSISVRGIGQLRNGEAPMAIVVDGVLQSSPLQFNQELLDITQIEVLKGPQGALYGRNAIAGAINITTRLPGDELKGHAQVGIANGNTGKVSAAVGGALIEDVLLAKIAASGTWSRGLIKNSFLDKYVDDQDEQTVSGRLIYKASEALTVDLRGFYADTQAGSSYFVRPTTRRDVDRTVLNADYIANHVLAPISNNAGWTDRKLSDAALKIDYEAAYGTFTAISSLSKVDHLVTFDGYDYAPNTYCIDIRTGGPGSSMDRPFDCAAPQLHFAGAPLAAFNTTYQDYDIRNFSQEVRFTSDQSGDFKYIVGAYFLSRHRDLITATQEDRGIGIIPRLDFDPATPNQTRTYFAENNRDKAYAAFGQLNYDVTEQVELSAALRYDLDERHQSDPRPNPYRVDGYGFPILAAASRKADFDSWQPKLSLTWRPSADYTFYGSYSHGFRSGGFNAPGTEVSPFTGEPIAQSVYGKETSVSYETGFKGRLFDGKAHVNASLFYTDVDDLQAFNFSGAVNAQIVTPINRVEIKGAELELATRLMKGLNLMGGVGFTDAKIKRFDANPVAEGNQVPMNIKVSYQLALQHHVPLTDRVELATRLEWEHRGRKYMHEGGDPVGIPVRDPLDLLNLRTSLTLDDVWTLTFWGRNLANKKYYEEVVVPDYAFQGRPRTFGMDLRVEF
ncbi:TonB-dependent receptor [Niveispirillum sp. KHB5.9]|uniref:TonB-dependent receptor n=1 Tax=Niveispirillum sp. KHB5.9 TaxID=3400269 RepID=UPI003A884E78